jgi:L-fuculokinase
LSEARRGGAGALDLVLDIGKTRSKLLVLDATGALVAAFDRASGSVVATPRAGRPAAAELPASPSYLALDTDGLAAWLADTVRGLGPLRQRLARAVVSAHGAAFALVDAQGLVLPVADYEFDGFDQRPPDWARQIAPFAQTLSPDLPRGLNGATQIDWLERHFPAECQRGQWLPYAQYWAWWLSGVAASEVSSLGCHSHLWQPVAGGFSALAVRRGWSARFAPLRRAWEVLGPVRPALAAQLGLPPGLRVHVGVHDSNACLARHLRTAPRMTLVTTGTWVVVMAPGAPARALDAQRDLLGNVSVRQQPVPTGRFMGGRELQALCAGADPALANQADLARLLLRGVMALPGFEPQGGPFRTQRGQVVDAHGPLDLLSLSPAERASLGALYAAQMTAWLFSHLGGTGPVVVEGPFAHNPVYTAVLAALLPHDGVRYSADALEGTARGAWQLAHWTAPQVHAPATTAAQPPPAALLPALAALHARWLAALAAFGAPDTAGAPAMTGT